MHDSCSVTLEHIPINIQRTIDNAIADVAQHGAHNQQHGILMEVDRKAGLGTMSTL